MGAAIMTETEVVAAIELPAKNDPTAKAFTPNVTFRWMYGGRAFEVAISSGARQDIDTYCDVNLAALQKWDASQPYLSLQDVSGEQVTLTPYFRERLQAIIALIKGSGLTGHSVIVLSNSVKGRALQIYGQTGSLKSTIEQHWVVGYDKGIEKLAELVSP
jgi:hypothetical protein